MKVTHVFRFPVVPSPEWTLWALNEMANRFPLAIHDQHPDGVREVRVRRELNERDRESIEYLSRSFRETFGLELISGGIG